MPLEQGQVEKSQTTQLNHTAPTEKDVIAKDIRAPLISFTFDLQKDHHANNPNQQGIVDQSINVNF